MDRMSALYPPRANVGHGRLSLSIDPRRRAIVGTQPLVHEARGIRTFDASSVCHLAPSGGAMGRAESPGPSYTAARARVAVEMGASNGTL